VGEVKDDAFAKRIMDMLSFAEKGKRTIGDAIDVVSAREAKDVRSTNKLAEKALSVRKDFLDNAQSMVEKKEIIMGEKMAIDVQTAAERLAKEKALLDDRMSGKFSKDISEFLQKGDPQSVHRLYDIPKSMCNPDKFFEDITRNLAVVENNSGAEAEGIASRLYNGLINGSGPGNCYSKVINDARTECSPAFHLPTEGVRDWFVDDVQEIADCTIDTVVADYLTMKSVDTYEASAFRDKTISEADALVFSGNRQ
jgi:hypothetical protein